MVLGDRDWVGTADRLMAALPSASLITLAGVDHFATPSDFGAIDTTIKFLGLSSYPLEGVPVCRESGSSYLDQLIPLASDIAWRNAFAALQEGGAFDGE